MPTHTSLSQTTDSSRSSAALQVIKELHALHRRECDLLTERVERLAAVLTPEDLLAAVECFDDPAVESASLHLMALANKLFDPVAA